MKSSKLFSLCEYLTILLMIEAIALLIVVMLQQLHVI